MRRERKPDKPRESSGFRLVLLRTFPRGDVPREDVVFRGVFRDDAAGRCVVRDDDLLGEEEVFRVDDDVFRTDDDVFRVDADRAVFFPREDDAAAGRFF